MKICARRTIIELAGESSDSLRAIFEGFKQRGIMSSMLGDDDGTNKVHTVIVTFYQDDDITIDKLRRRAEIYNQIADMIESAVNVQPEEPYDFDALRHLTEKPVEDASDKCFLCGPFCGGVTSCP